MLYFWLLLLAHGLADFVLQNNRVSAAKCANKWQGYALHGLAIFLCTFAAVHFFGWESALLAAGVITGVHLSLDWLKNLGREYQLKKGRKPGVQGLIIDQCLHILTLFLAWRLADRPVDTAVARFYGGILSPLGQLPGTEEMVGLAVYAYAIFGGAVFIRIALDKSLGYILADSRDNVSRLAEYIGILSVSSSSP